MNSQTLPFTVQRTIILAPHPDDDVIAAGGLIQRVLAARGEVHVVFITDGENNPWPQRLIERKFFLESGDRAKWGAMRRRGILLEQGPGQVQGGLEAPFAQGPLDPRLEFGRGKGRGRAVFGSLGHVDNPRPSRTRKTLL